MGGDKLMDQIFNLKFTSKQLVRQANKCEKEEKAEKNKVKKAIEKGNIEGAKIYAQVRPPRPHVRESALRDVARPRVSYPPHRPSTYVPCRMPSARRRSS
mmetsp:Transcript_39660/g.126735  ORF Transcript_39660/g.126735 Transcript_39660/m.126735 type:complete len:100 (+) Transcript_39660:133-432(+)